MPKSMALGKATDRNVESKWKKDSKGGTQKEGAREEKQKNANTRTVEKNATYRRPGKERKGRGGKGSGQRRLKVPRPLEDSGGV